MNVITLIMKQIHFVKNVEPVYIRIACKILNWFLVQVFLFIHALNVVKQIFGINEKMRYNALYVFNNSEHCYESYLKRCQMAEKIPPIGLSPINVHRSNRIIEIINAIGRYTADKYPIPMEWIEEYNDLIAEKEMKKS